ncbi:MAG: class I SAM-dependent rRNA methyltransferase [Alphaproteobacteria bacterium]|nr:class I SAM-dependent rRNA methyltransferase [Alphaproteobacteria bacterium]
MPAKLPELSLTRDAVAPVTRGHPWVYRDGLRGSAEVGDLIRLLEPSGKVVAVGLFDEGNICVRVLGEPTDDLAALLRDRLRRADDLRRRLLPANTDAYRVVNAAGDGLPGLVLDRYGELAVLRIYSAAWARHEALLARTIAALPWVGTVFRRLGVARVDGEQGGRTLAGPEAPRTLVVQEHGLKFLVRPYEGQKTGLFLDQREHRRRVGELSAGRQVINLFGYTGGFSVYAAAAGAARVSTVDIAAPALEDAKENFRLNGLAPERHVFEAADVFAWRPSGRADLVICDPPNLSRGKQADGNARGAYRDLNAQVGEIVSRDGLLVTASCTARLDARRWEDAVREGLRRSGRWALLERAEAPADHPVAFEHPEGRYLKLALLRRLSDPLARR